jgi:flagellar motor protein MotB
MKISINATTLFLTIDYWFASKKAFTEQEMSAQDPIASNKTVAGRAQNRRVEILIMN